MELNVNGHNTYVYTGTQALQAEQQSLVFVHGAAMDHSVWILQSRYFAYHQRNVLAVDLPGHGRSQGALLTNIEAIADWLIAVLDVAGIEEAVFIGHSMGSLAVLDAAARHGQRVARIALLGASCPMSVAAPLLDAAKANDPAAIDMITVWGHSAQSHLGGNRAPGLWMTGGGQRLLERAAPGVLFNDLNACNEYQTGLDCAAAVACPALMISGQHDMMTPVRAARPLLAALPNVQSVNLTGCGHMMSYERPDEVLDALIGFV